MVLQPSFLHTDFNKWRDEDDSEEEDTGMDDDFEAVSYNSTKSNIHLLCVCSVTDHRWHQNVVRRKIVTQGTRPSVSHFDIFCDLSILCGPTATGNALFCMIIEKNAVNGEVI